MNFDSYATLAAKNHTSRDQAFESDGVKKTMLDSYVRSKEAVPKSNDLASKVFHILEFGSFNQFKDVTAHINKSTLRSMRDKELNTLLMLSAKAGKLEYVIYLLERGLDINAVNVGIGTNPRNMDLLHFTLPWATTTTTLRTI
jgi:hypothetical protein